MTKFRDPEDENTRFYNNSKKNALMLYLRWEPKVDVNLVFDIKRRMKYFH